MTLHGLGKSVSLASPSLIVNLITRINNIRALLDVIPRYQYQASPVAGILALYGELIQKAARTLTSVPFTTNVH